MITQFNNEDGVPINVDARHVESLAPHPSAGYINLCVGNILIAVEGSLASVSKALIDTGVALFSIDDGFPALDDSKGSEIGAPLLTDLNPPPPSEDDIPPLIVGTND